MVVVFNKEAGEHLARVLLQLTQKNTRNAILTVKWVNVKFEAGRLPNLRMNGKH